MLRIALVNMPYGPVDTANLGLMRLKALVDKKHSQNALANLFHLNHEFVSFIGLPLYETLATPSSSWDISLFSEWLFARAAFPDMEDNARSVFPILDLPLKVDESFIQRMRLNIDRFLERMIKQYDLANYDIVGMTTVVQQRVPNIALARRLKQHNPHVITIAGGPLCEYPMGKEMVKQFDVIDFIFSGRALVSFDKFVEFQVKGDVHLCHRINGVFSKNNVALVNDTRTSQLPNEAFGGNMIEPYGGHKDINDLLDLDYNSFLGSVERLNLPEPVIPFETSQGCHWAKRSHCKFCGINGACIEYFEMSPSNALKQFHKLFELVPRCKKFSAVDNIIPPSYSESVFPHLNSSPDISIYYNARADLRSDELKTLRLAQVRSIQVGIETLSTPMLRILGKGTTASQNIRYLRDCIKNNIVAYWYLLLGIPGETNQIYEELLALIPKITHLQPPSMVLPVSFPRYSPYYENAEEYNLTLEPHWLFKYVYPFSNETLRKLSIWHLNTNEELEFEQCIRRWMHTVLAEVGRWQGRFKANKPPKLQLLTENGTKKIYDSRGDKVKVYKINSLTHTILMKLEKPLTLHNLARKLGINDINQLKSEIELLNCKELLFEEGGKFLNLITNMGVS